MDILKTIKTRRSVRRYKDKKLPDAIIRKILDVVRYSPNSSNLQQWRFIVINNRSQLNKLSWLIDKNVDDDLKKKHALEKRPVEERYFYNAPCLILICGPRDHVWSEADCAIASQTVMLYAHSLGLGSCWMGFPVFVFARNRRLARTFGVPEDCQVYASLILGYPKEIPPMLPRKNTEIIKWFK